jgi:alpha-1,2-mannosyltransferase
VRLRKNVFLLLVLGCILFALIFIFNVRDSMRDFEVNYRAGGRIWSGETLYRTADSHWQFKYSPFSALIYLPLSALPLPAAKAIWYVLILFSIGTIVMLSLHLARVRPDRKILIGTISFLILAKFFFRELELGQINAVVTAVLLGMALFLTRQETSEDAAAGLFWGLATALKPYSLIFFPYFVLKKRWRALIVGSSVILFSLFIPAIFYGVRGNLTVLREWTISLSQSTPILLAAQDNVSLLGFLAKWTGGSPGALIVFAGLVAALAGLTLAFVFKGKKVPVPVVLDSGLLLTLIPLLSPLGWDYTFLSSFLATVLVLDHFSVFPIASRACLIIAFALIGLSFYDLLGRRLYASFMSASILTLAFLIIAAALLSLRMKEAA